MVPTAVGRVTGRAAPSSVAAVARHKSLSVVARGARPARRQALGGGRTTRSPPVAAQGKDAAAAGRHPGSNSQVLL